MKPMLAVLSAVLLCGCAVIYEPDIRSDKNTVICHKGKQTLVLPEEAVGAHIAHGDSYGDCRGR